MREVALWSHVVDAGRETAQYTLDQGHSLFIVPGGEHEQVGAAGCPVAKFFGPVALSRFVLCSEIVGTWIHPRCSTSEKQN